MLLLCVWWLGAGTRQQCGAEGGRHKAGFGTCSVVTAQLALTRWKPPSRGREGVEKWWREKREDLRGRVAGEKGKVVGEREKLKFGKVWKHLLQTFVKTQRH